MKPALTSRAQPRWWRLYFALAAFDLITISFSLWLNHRLMQTHESSVRENQAWAERIGRFSDLAQLAGAVNAPGNDVFDTRAVDEESARLQVALGRFNRELSRVESSLYQDVPPAQAERLRHELKTVNEAMEEMVAEAELIFSFFRRNLPDKAGERMATMDRKLAGLNAAFSRLGYYAREIQRVAFEAQQAQADAFRRYEILIAAAIVAMVIAVTIYGHRMARVMADVMREKDSYLAELHESHALLDERVRQRTAELQAANAQLSDEVVRRTAAQRAASAMQAELIEASRQAGKAEVATGVIHNIGNVLNSVNVSVSITREQLRKSKAASLARAVAMMREHSGNMAEFLAHDPKGSQLPGFIGALSDELGREQAALLQETQALEQNVAHIKQIVSMQQSFAKASGVLEYLAPHELIEEAMSLASAALQRHRIQVVREYEPVPAILADRHTVLQILVNLVTNAKQALDARTDGRLLTLRVAQAEGNKVRVEVSDNGAGIAPGNLARIFNHGFTTKKSGHGFGLHSGANAAKEMGGSLTVRSDGPGAGATFTLELPLAREAVATERAA